MPTTEVGAWSCRAGITTEYDGLHDIFPLVLKPKLTAEVHNAIKECSFGR